VAVQTWTQLTGRYVKRRLNVRLCFGESARSRRLAGGVQHYWFAPGQLLGVCWWARVSPRRQVAGFAVAEALVNGQTGHLLPCVRPAVRVHAFLCGRCVGDDRGVAGRAEQWVKLMRRAGVDPCRVPAAYWRLAGQALRVGRAPRPFSDREVENYRMR
jgi:hypothetical protein